VAEVSIKRPIFIMMVILAVVVLGVNALYKLPVDLFPNIEFPFVTVVTVYPGASPTEMESLVTDKIEDGLSALSDMKNMTSKSMESVSMVAIEFKAEADPDAKVADVREKIDALKSELPDDAEDPIIQKFDLNSFPIIMAAISSPRAEVEVRKTVEDDVKKILEKIPGVATVAVSGGKERQINIDVDRDKMFGYNLSILQLVQSLTKDNMNFPVGKIKKGTEENVVRVIGEHSKVSEIGNVDIMTQMGPIKIRDIATVNDGFKDVEAYSRLGGNNSILIQIVKQSGANTVQVSKQVKETLDKMPGRSIPADYDVSVVMDLSTFITNSLSDVKTNLLYGAIFATLMIMLFLRDPRSTFIIFLAIPTAILSTFMPVYMAGFTLNFMSLMGLAIAVGTLVDNSVVVLENIFRHLEMGKSAKEAAKDGVSEVGLAVLASGTTNVCVYTPVAFMSGTVGQFFKEFGFSVAFATAFAIFIAFTLTPAVASRILKLNDAAPKEMTPGKKFAISVMTVVFFWIVIPFKYVIYPAFDFGYGLLRKVYPKAIYFSLKAWPVPAIVTAVLFFSSIAIVGMGLIGSEFVPDSDQGEFNVMVQMPAYASLDDTDKVVRQVEEMVKGIKEVEAYTAVSGQKIGDTGVSQPTPDYGFLSVKLVDMKDRKRSTKKIMQQIRKDVADIPDATFQVTARSMVGAPGQLPLQVEVKGADYDVLIPLTEKIYHITEKIPGVIDLNSSWRTGKSEIQVTLDKQKMVLMGLDVATVGYTMRVSLEGDDSVKFKEKGDEYDILVRFSDKDRMTVQDVQNIPLMTQMGAIKLGNIASIKQELGPNEYSRKNGVPQITISGNLAERSSGEVQRDIAKAVEEKLELPEGYEIGFGHNAEDMQDMMTQLIVAMILAILFVYMVMAAQFESLIYPFVVMFTLPLTFIGVVWSLFLTGSTFNMMSMIGMVMLIGIVVNNSIVLVDFVNQLRAKGVPRNNAIIQAGITRLRPILITSLTTICAMIPSAVLSGEGAGFRRPMAIVGVGGMIVATILTLIIIPIMYMLIDAIMDRIRRLVRRTEKQPVWGTKEELKTLLASGALEEKRL